MKKKLHNKTVAILLCTFNGSKYLQEQLNSIAAQTYSMIDIYASDDGSDDSTLDILCEFQAKWCKGSFVIFNGPRSGFANNFMSLVLRQDINADYYSYADQDDIWEVEKIETAIHRLVKMDASLPLLYCSRTCLIDELGNKQDYSTLYKKPPAFANALVQSIASGNTMVLNHKARILLTETSSCSFFSHDWWTYMMVTGSGGEVFYDPYPSVRYRQHADNVIGGHIGWNAKMIRIKMLFAGRFHGWNDIHVQSLSRVGYLLTDRNKQILENFILTRKGPLHKRLYFYIRSGVYRQTALDNAGLLIALVAQKL